MSEQAKDAQAGTLDGLPVLVHINAARHYAVFEFQSLADLRTFLAEQAPGILAAYDERERRKKA